MTTNWKKLATGISLFAVLFGAVVLVNKIPGNSAMRMLGGSVQVPDLYSPYKIESFNDAWITAKEFDASDLSDHALVEAENIDFSSQGSIAPRTGSIILGTASSSIYPITSLHTSKSLEGRELLLRSASTTVEWYNEDNSTWENLLTTTTTNQQFVYADGNNSNEIENQTYFANGSDPLYRFRIAFDSISSATTTEIILNPVDGFNNAIEIGFATSTETAIQRTVRIGGVNYTYDSVAGWNLQGLSALPALAANTGVIGAPDKASFNRGPGSATGLVIKDQRLYASYKNSVYCSRIDSLTDFGFSAPRLAAEGEIAFFPDGGQKINGLGVRPEYVAVFKDNYIGSLTFSDYSTVLSDIPSIKTVALGYKIGATSQKAISNLGFENIFSKGDIGISTLTRLQNTDFDQAVNLTDNIRPTLETYDFSNSALIAYKNIILNATSDGTTDFNNKIILYNTLYKRLSEISGWNANAFTSYKGDIYYGDSINPNVYKIFTTDYDDNGLPYTSSFKTKWYNFGEVSKWKELGYVFVEGFISKNTTLKFRINLDEGGALSSKEVDIVGTGNYVASAASSGFAINPFGLINFASVPPNGPGNLLHFAGYINTGDLVYHKFRNVQFEGDTSGTGQNYRITKIVPFVNVLNESWGRSNANYIISN